MNILKVRHPWYAPHGKAILTEFMGLQVVFLDELNLSFRRGITGWEVNLALRDELCL